MGGCLSHSLRARRQSRRRHCKDCDHFSVTTLPTYTGPDVRVYSIEDIISDVNIECGTAVGTDDIDMEFSQADIADATPTNLRRAVGAGGHLPAIAHWSRPQPPGSAPLPWHAETIPAVTPAPPGAYGTTAFATTAPPAARFEGLTLTDMARAQAPCARWPGALGS